MTWREPLRLQLRPDAQRGQQSDHGRRGEVGAQELVDPWWSDGEPDRLGYVAPDVDGPGGDGHLRSTGQPEQLAEPLRGTIDAGRVAAPLEPGRGLGAQAQPLRGPGDGHGHEVGRFEQDPRRVRADLRGGAAHHPADAHGSAGGVADEAVLAAVVEAGPRTAERPLHPVEGGEGLARPGPPDDQPMPGQPVEVVGVAGLSELEHHVVGRVDHVVDGAHAGQGQTSGQPLGGRSHPDPGDHPGGEPGAQLRSSTTTVANVSTAGPVVSWAIDRSAAASPPTAASSAEVVGMAKGSPKRAARSRATPAMHQASGRLASTATSKTASVSMPERLGQRPPDGGPVHVGQQQDPVVVLGQTELPTRAQHPVGRHALHLGPLDLHVPRAAGLPPGPGPPDRPRRSSMAPHTTSTGPRPSSTTTRRILSAPGMAATSSILATTSRRAPPPPSRSPRRPGRGRRGWRRARPAHR